MNSTRPVSYTHLDVYKRQVEKRGKTYVIKESERPKLDNEYLKMLQRLGLTPSPPFGTQAQLTPTPPRETPQAGQMCIRDSISLVFDDPAVVCLTPAVRTPALAGNASLQGSLVAVQLRCISGRSIVGRSIEGRTERRPGAQTAPEQVRKADQEYQNTTGQMCIRDRL